MKIKYFISFPAHMPLTMAINFLTNAGYQNNKDFLIKFQPDDNKEINSFIIVPKAQIILANDALSIGFALVDLTNNLTFRDLKLNENFTFSYPVEFSIGKIFRKISSRKYQHVGYVQDNGCFVCGKKTITIGTVGCEVDRWEKK